METITILKRNNGEYWTYINGEKLKALSRNSHLSSPCDILINDLICLQSRYPNAKIIFTDKEESIKTEKTESKERTLEQEILLKLFSLNKGA